ELGANEDPSGVNIHGALPELGCDVQEAHDRTDGSVVDHDVEPPENVHRPIDGPLNLLGYRDVGTDDQHLAARGLNGCCSLVSTLLIYLDDGHAGTMPSEGGGPRPTQPRPASGNEGNLAGEGPFTPWLSHP